MHDPAYLVFLKLRPLIEMCDVVEQCANMGDPRLAEANLRALIKAARLAVDETLSAVNADQGKRGQFEQRLTGRKGDVFI
jgi:hypothetical protein